MKRSAAKLLLFLSGVIFAITGHLFCFLCIGLPEAISGRGNSGFAFCF